VEDASEIELEQKAISLEKLLEIFDIIREICIRDILRGHLRQPLMKEKH